MILSRVPVKSRLGFKCVCKSWRSIITHPHFINTHFLRSTESPHCPRLLLGTSTSSLSFSLSLSLSLSLSFLSYDFESPNHESESLECPWDNSDSYSCPLCSCDGLILLWVYEGTNSFKFFLLWNPSIRSYKRISCPYELPFISLCGLCYHSTADDHMVFILSQENETSVVSYSFRNDSWNKIIHNRYCCCVSEHPAALVNGVVHWVMYSRELSSCVIVYFDLVEGKFKEVPPPSSLEKDDGMNLVVLGEHLCVYCDIDVEQIGVYAMEEYGKKDSWARLFVRPTLPSYFYVCEAVVSYEERSSIDRRKWNWHL